jgi:DNA-binding NtrC family response regulator
MKILVIEDDDVVRSTLIDMLKFKQHAADGTTSAEEALRRLPGDYDLVISDILLQGMDGVTLLGKVNQMDPGVPVVMITGYGEAELEEKCRKNGAAGFLKKPFTVQSLLDLVDEVVKKKTA